ncbi:MAG: right-handed parallel beta-helix repeat-containing protein [bacterium]
MFKVSSPLLLVSSAFLAFQMIAASPLEIHVSTKGIAGASGNASEPLPSISAARDLIRSLPAERRTNGVTVLVGDGLYSMPEGVLLETQDSGTADSPIVYTAEKGGRPLLVGGHTVTDDFLEPVKEPKLLDRLDPLAKDHVRQVDLSRLGVQKITPFAQAFAETWRPLQVVHMTNTLPMSRWPNGEYGFTTMQSVTDNGDATHGGTFVYREDRPLRWMKAMNDGGVWLRGFWRVPWVINGAQVKEINVTNSTITLMKDVGGGIGSKYKKDAMGRRCGDGTEAWYAINLPEEIDSPGEWSIDFNRNLLLLWPPEGINRENPLLVAANTNPIISLHDVSYVAIKGLSFAGSLAPAIEIRGGEGNLVAGCTVRNIGKTGVFVREGKHHKIISNDIAETGLRGVDITGGNKATLEPSGHEVINNDISRAGNDFPVPAVMVGYGSANDERRNAVGIHLKNNRIHDSANAGVVFGGADNLFELNEIYRVGLNSGDLGGFYGYSGFTGFGNSLRNNFVHHSMNANAFYVDDGTSGVTVSGNVVYKTAMGVLMGGGHYNRFEHNIMVDCPKGIHLDDRGISRKYTLNDKRLGGDIALIPFNQSPWKDRHPELAALVASGESTIPKGDVVLGNVLINCATPIELPKPENCAGIDVKGNVTNGVTADFLDAENFDFTLKPGSTLVASIDGFPPIPFHEIGLQVDEYRKSIPPRDMKLLHEGDTTKRKFSSTTDIDASNKK